MEEQSQYQSSGRVLQITPWERQALQLLADGYSVNDAAAGIGISAIEMQTLLPRLFAALGAATQAEAINAANRRGLLTCGALVVVSALTNG